MSIDLNAVQDEDEISKVTLAHEIERTRGLFHSCDSEISTQMEATILKAQAMVDSIIEKNGVYMEELDKKFNEALKKKEKELEIFVNSSLAQFMVTLNDYKRTIDLKFSGFDESIEEKTREEIDENIGIVSRASLQMGKDLVNFQKQTSDLLTKIQGEIVGKISSLEKRFEDTRSKFSLIAESLKK